MKSSPMTIATPLLTGLILFIGAGLPLLHAATVETPQEFQLDADLDGDGRADLVIVDKVSGALRVGYQSTLGVPSWAPVRASGLAEVTGVNAGRLLSLSREGLALVSPLANRVTLLEASNAAAPILPVAVYPPSVGPNAVAAVDIVSGGNTAHDDLYVLTRENPGPRETLLRNTGTSRTLLADNGLALPRSSPNRFELKSGQPQRLGLWQRAASGGNDSFSVLDFQAGTANVLITQSVPLANTPAAPEFLAARFNAQPLAQVLFYQPGSNSVLHYQSTEPVPGTFALNASGSFNLGGTIQSLVLAPGPADTRLIALLGPTPTNATTASIFSFDGVNPPVLVQSFSHPTGFSGATALGNGHLALLGGDGSGRSSSFEVKMRSGQGYTNGVSGPLPAVSPHSGLANVLMLNGEPFVNETARPLRVLRAADWSSAPILTGAPPASLLVRGENYGGTSNGLINGSTIALGNAPLGTTHVLVNQYSNGISVFSLRPASGDESGRISIQPPSGQYPSAIQVTLNAAPAGWGMRYRLAAAGSWLTYTAPFFVISNLTLQCYAFDPGSSAKTAVEQVHYSFSTPVSRLDSDRDGVPDAVELAYGLDPRSGRDSDGDGFSDLDEIIRGTNPATTNSVPPSSLELGGTFERVTSPSAPNGTGTFTLTSTGANLRAWSLGHVFLAETTTANLNLPGVPASAARYIAKPGDGEVLSLETTDYHFAFPGNSSTQKFGRELVGLVRIPPLGQPALPELNQPSIPAWVQAASNVLAGYSRPQSRGELTPAVTTVALLVERTMALALTARGTNWGTNATLFGFRTPDATRQVIDSGVLLNLETYAGPSAPAYLAGPVHDHYESAVLSNQAPEMVALRNVAAEFWRVSSAYHDPTTNSLPLPLDAVRHFLVAGAVHPDYAPFFNLNGSLAAASLAAQNLLSTAPRRPTTNLVLEVVSLAPGAPTTFRVEGTATPATLWRQGGSPCVLPANFNLVVGSKLAVFAFHDVKEVPGTLGLEVINLGLNSVPVISSADQNGNLLPDAWEYAFFGGPLDQLGDADGDGYSNLQEMLDGTDPSNPQSLPILPVVNFNNPNVELENTGGTLKVLFHWPPGYLGNFNFGVQATTALGTPFTPINTIVPCVRVGDTIEMSLLPENGQWGDPHRFFILTVGLR